MLNFDGVVGGGVPAAIAQQTSPWFSSDAQYEAFLQNTASELGPQCITATSIEVDHLDELHRKEMLSRHSLRPTLEYVCTTFARLDDAALFSRINAFEKQFTHGLTGELATKVRPPIKNGAILMPPAAITLLIREIIEWCPDADADAPGNALPPLNLNNFVQLVLSINGDQERQDTPEFFKNKSWPPTAEELAEFNAAMTVDDDMMVSELRRHGLSELARMQAEATTVPEMVLGDTYDTWCKGWPNKAPHDLIGETPEAAFHAATTVSLPAFINLACDSGSTARPVT
jgi:hypothetical protein